MHSSFSTLIQLLAQEAYMEGGFVLSSGNKSDFYLDLKKVTYRSSGLQLVGDAVLAKIRTFDVVGVGGLTMGAEAILMSTIWASLMGGDVLHGFSVRKEAKVHGLQKVIEGVIPSRGSRVAIVDDVITKGGSILHAVKAARDAGLEVAVVVPLVDRLEGGKARIIQEGLDFRPVCTIDEVRAAHQEMMQEV